MKLTWNIFYMDVFEKHKNRNSILKINEHHGEVPNFQIKPVIVFYVEDA